VELNNLRPEAESRSARLFPQRFGHPDQSAAEPRTCHEPAKGNLPVPPQTKEEALTLCSRQVLDLVASFQHAVVGDLMKKTFAAAESLGAARILVTGGVAANRELRARFTAEAVHRGLRVAFPTLALSTDNAAMIATAAWPRFQAGEFATQDLSADPSLALGH